MSIYYMLNKPAGYITARRDPRHATVMDLFPEELRDVIFPVGRLDKDTEGLLLLTDDGKLSYGLMMPDHGVCKTYFLYATGVLTEEMKNALEQGVRIDDKGEIVTAMARVEHVGADILKNISGYLSEKERRALNDRRRDRPVFAIRLTITEGKKHQVKRMLKAVGSRVLYLRRESIAGVPLDKGLPLGCYRDLYSEELKQLRKAAGLPEDLI